jgi:hypothetical protein
VPRRTAQRTRAPSVRVLAQLRSIAYHEARTCCSRLLPPHSSGSPVALPSDQHGDADGSRRRSDPWPLLLVNSSPKSPIGRSAGSRASASFLSLVPSTSRRGRRSAFMNGVYLRGPRLKPARAFFHVPGGRSTRPRKRDPGPVARLASYLGYNSSLRWITCRGLAGRTARFRGCCSSQWPVGSLSSLGSCTTLGNPTRPS